MSFDLLEAKGQLIKHLLVTEKTKLNHLLTELMLRNRAPSQLLREMKQSGDDKVDSKLLKPLWLHRLAENTQGILACMDSGCLDKLAMTRDKQGFV